MIKKIEKTIESGRKQSRKLALVIRISVILFCFFQLLILNFDIKTPDYITTYLFLVLGMAPNIIGLSHVIPTISTKIEKIPRYIRNPYECSTYSLKRRIVLNLDFNTNHEYNHNVVVILEQKSPEIN
ncbi:MAG: hypothetical protein BAJATHORv1_60055 [Candidatus Thorarchaeota archaeon]|nr:MAG: hypothetical protein BAJATHORv1_60055 [Candidatus Thorarchaeota archaeon]